MAVPIGHAGSWFAVWQGESNSCIHQHALNRGHYLDDGVDDHPAWPKFISGLQEKRKAIVTTSRPPGADGIRRRKSYVGIWKIDNVELGDGTLSFKLGRMVHRF